MLEARKKKLYLPVILLLLFVSACSSTQNNGTETETIDTPMPPVYSGEPDLPFKGVWFSEDRASILIFTDDTFYHRVLGLERETYAEIVEYDLDAGHIKIKYYDIMSNGNHMGFDSPTWHLTYQIEENTIRIAIESMDYPAEVEPLIFYFDEVLSK